MPVAHAEVTEEFVQGRDGHFCCLFRIDSGLDGFGLSVLTPREERT